MAETLSTTTTRARTTVVGVLTGAHDRVALEAAPHTHIADSIAGVPALIASTAELPASASSVAP
jgi:phosphoglycolate phosphatase-like HAD superfamily hydrolase